MPMKDHVDLVLAQWAQQRPDLDVSVMAVCSRLFRMNIVAARNADQAFRAHGMHQASSICSPPCSAPARPMR